MATQRVRIYINTQECLIDAELVPIYKKGVLVSETPMAWGLEILQIAGSPSDYIITRESPNPDTGFNANTRLVIGDDNTFTTALGPVE